MEDTEKKLLGLLQDAAVLVHKYHFETTMPVANVCKIVEIIANNYVDTIESMPEDEFTIKKNN